MSDKQAIRVCLLAFAQMDLVDFAGPLETLSHARDQSYTRLFSVQVAGPTDAIQTSQGLKIHRDISYEEAFASLSEYDVLIIPGANYKTTNELCVAGSCILDLIKQFAESEATEQHRVLLSICSGAFFLASTGVLKGRRATTHYTIIPQLEQACEKHGNTQVVRKRFVDAGLLENRVRVVSSGGITSGFDCYSLYNRGPVRAFLCREG